MLVELGDNCPHSLPSRRYCASEVDSMFVIQVHDVGCPGYRSLSHCGFTIRSKQFRGASGKLTDNNKRRKREIRKQETNISAYKKKSLSKLCNQRIVNLSNPVDKLGPASHVGPAGRLLDFTTAFVEVQISDQAAAAQIFKRGADKHG